MTKVLKAEMAEKKIALMHKERSAEPLLQITISGPKQDSKELPTLMQEVVVEWLKEKDRRKL